LIVAYTVTFTHAAAKSIEKLDRGILRRIQSKIVSLADRPRPPGSVKLAGQPDLHRIRIGDYRVVYRVDDAARAVEVAIVAHRRAVYRDL
jgi:mRNA interferase RelE/StbE